MDQLGVIEHILDRPLVIQQFLGKLIQDFLGHIEHLLCVLLLLKTFLLICSAFILFRTLILLGLQAFLLASRITGGFLPLTRLA
mmetsp:Transcript_18733/g.22134  ORF Transcript_18733/g.22134 Transcript_18733/m.22134 type:complete len:84 (+) Transcript_18733:1063-1314(+)